MSLHQDAEVRTHTAISADGTPIAYHSLGYGRGLVIVGGVLSSGSTYMALARALAPDFEVHVMERRGRPGSGPQRDGHGIEAECADLTAVAAATGAMSVFGHSFGGLVALETARRQTPFDQLFLYEPAVPLRGQLASSWIPAYEQLLVEGDRRGAFALMVKTAGHAPAPIAMMPMGCLRVMLRFAIRGEKWSRFDALLEANAVEHRVLAALDAPTAERFSSVMTRTVLLGGAQSPPSSSTALLRELADVIPDASIVVLPKLRHGAPEDHSTEVAGAIRSSA